MSAHNKSSEVSEQETRCGFVAVIGAPNAGKSTLVNNLVGGKVSIVSPKAQTTRSLVKGIGIAGNSQIVFLDTPGLFEPRKTLEKAIVAAAWEGQKDVDAIMLVVDASRYRPGNLSGLLEKLSKQRKNRPYILALNKIDKIKREKLLAMTATLNDLFDFDATFMVSALKNSGVDDLRDYLAARMPRGIWLYPEDQISDMPMRLLAAEITREKLFRALHDELPYGLTVDTESWEERADGSVMIRQLVYVARESHKPIVLGKGGAMIKRVGQQSRTELEEMTGTTIHLKLFVKVDEKWMESAEHYARWGLDPRA